MSVIHYRDYGPAARRWADQEIRNLTKQQNEKLEADIAASLIAHALLDTAPSELSYDYQGGDVA